jgi:tetratricopeptide (TPR) repeat protein
LNNGCTATAATTSRRNLMAGTTRVATSTTPETRLRQRGEDEYKRQCRQITNLMLHRVVSKEKQKSVNAGNCAILRTSDFSCVNLRVNYNVSIWGVKTKKISILPKSPKPPIARRHGAPNHNRVYDRASFLEFGRVRCFLALSMNIANPYPIKRFAPCATLAIALCFPGFSLLGDPPEGKKEPAATSENDPKEKPPIPAEPLVSRVELRLTIGEKEVDVIEKGDLVTVLEDRGSKYKIRTYRGINGVVEKVNVLTLAESVEVYDELIKEQPTVGRLHTLRAGAQWARGNIEAALNDFDEAIKLGYDTANAYSSRALFFTATHQYDKAVADFDKAIDKGEKTESIYLNRAAALMQMNKVDDKAIKLNEKNAGIYQQRATAYKVKRDFGKSVADFTKAIELSPNFIPAIMGRGYVYFQAGDHAKAIDDFSAVIKLNDRASVAYNNRGYNYQLLGKNTEALTDFNKSIELTPEYALAHQNRAWLLATCEDASMRDPKAAIESATKACELNQYNDLSDMAALAASHASAKEFDLAIGIQEKIVERAPEEQKSMAKKLLDLYKEEKPFDPKIASEAASLNVDKTAKQ